MAGDPKAEVTRLLEEAQAGRSEAVGELFQVVYQELHGVAERKMRLERQGHLLQPTALVNETYLKLFGKGPAPLSCRQQFFSAASAAMRHILIDVSRSESASKRGGRPEKVELEEWMQISSDSPDRQLDVQRAVDALAEIDARAAQVVQLTLYGGREPAEIAELLGVTRRTVERDLAVARLFLRKHLQGGAKSA